MIAEMPVFEADAFVDSMVLRSVCTVSLGSLRRSAVMIAFEAGSADTLAAALASI